MKESNIITYILIAFSMLIFSCGSNEEPKVNEVAIEAVLDETETVFNSLETFNDSVAYLKYKLEGLPNDLALDFFREYGLDSIDIINERLYPNQQSASRILAHFISLIDDDGYGEWNFLPESNWPRVNYWEHLILNLPEEVKHPDSYSGYLDRRPQEKSFASMLFSIDRTEENLTRFWTIFRETAFNLVSKQDYYAKGHYRYVDALLLTYDEILKKDEPRMILDQLKREHDKLEYHGSYQSIRLCQPYVPIKVLLEFEGNNFNKDLIHSDETYVREQYTSTQTAWFVSFWMRRNSEGCLDVSKRILQDIQDHYNEASSDSIQSCYEIVQKKDSISLTNGEGPKSSKFEFNGVLFENGRFSEVANQIVYETAVELPMGESQEIEDVSNLSSEEIFGKIRSAGEKIISEIKPGEWDDGMFSFELNTHLAGSHNQFKTLSVSGWSYTGGAHGNGYTSYHVFDCSKDSMINVHDYIVRKNELIEKIKIQLREYAGVEEGMSLEDAGFDRITIAANIAITGAEVIFQYNAYEIGPYVLGGPTVSFTHEGIQKYLLLDL